MNNVEMNTPTAPLHPIRGSARRVPLLLATIGLLATASLELRPEENKDAGKTTKTKEAAKDPFAPETEAERAPRRKELREKLTKLRAEERAIQKRRKDGKATDFRPRGIRSFRTRRARRFPSHELFTRLRANRSDYFSGLPSVQL